MARMVGPEGRIVATDIDETKLAIARAEAAEHKLNNIEFLYGDISKDAPAGEFDLIHVRFVLTHLPDPAGALTNLFLALRPGGVLV